MPGGRPSDYSVEITTAICIRLGLGESLREICADETMPAKSTVMRWLASHAEFRDQYAGAREAQADYYAEEIIEISDDGSNDWMERKNGDGSTDEVENKEVLARSRLRVDTRKWLMARMAPKKYGDKVVQEHTGPGGGPVQVHRVERVIVDPHSLQLPTARVFKPLLEPARYKAAHGGRGSRKSHFFADLLIEDSLYERGLRSVCIREVQKSLKDSAKRLIEDKLGEHNLGEADGFKVFREVIETPGDGVITFQGMQDHTAESIKSLEGFKRAWAEEAQTLSARSLSLLRPTIRADDSQLWFSWNPRRKNDPVDMMLRGEHLPTGAAVVRANWSDNLGFRRCWTKSGGIACGDTPDQYDHIWEGGYATVTEGAYYASVPR